MTLKSKLKSYADSKKGVKHCTFDPDGPGVVRMHLIPPRFRLFGSDPYILVLNGYYLLPVGYSWAMMLGRFMDGINRYDGQELSEEDIRSVALNTVHGMRRIFPTVSEKMIRDDLAYILDVLFDIARGGKPDAEIEKLSVREYAPSMRAPHRMDLMVSAMTDDEGRWKCNQKCTFCYAAGQELSSSHEMSTEEWKLALDRLWAAGVPMVTFTGGEPTLRDDLAQLVEHARRFVTRLNTNGVLLDRRLADSLRAAGLDSVQITLYSHDPSIHNALVGSAHHSDTVRGIECAVASGLDISVNTPLCSLNRDYIKTLEMLHGMGVRFITLSGLICTGGARLCHGEHDLTEDELFETVREAKEFCDAHGMEMDFTSPGLISAQRLDELSLNIPSCGAALSNMAIAPDGRVIPCQSWLVSDAELGNILTDKFSDIWGHEICKRLRKMSTEEALSCPFRAGKGGSFNV